MTRTVDFNSNRYLAISDRSFPVAELPCYLLVLSLFFPTRGAIAGLSFYLVQFFSLFIFVLTIKRFQIPKIPLFVIVLLTSIIIMDLHLFSPSNWWYYVSNLSPLILAFLYIPSRIKTLNSFDRFIKFIIIIFSAYSIFCIIESTTSFNIFDTLTNTKIEVYAFTNEIRFGYIRNRGAVDISINNGMLLCLVLSLIAFYINHTHKKAYFLSYVLVFLAAFFSLSRTVWVQLAISQLIIFFGIKAKLKIRIILFVIFVLFVLLIMGVLFSSGFIINLKDLMDEMTQSIVDVFTGDNQSSMIGIGHRFSLWGWVTYAVGDKWLLGLGVGQPVKIITQAGYLKESIEVMILYVFYQGGLIGVIGFVFFQIGCLTMLYKSSIKMRHTNCNYFFYVLAASIGYFVAIFACSAFEDLRFYYILIALAISLKNSVFKNGFAKVHKYYSV